MAYLLFNPSLFATIKIEIRSAECDHLSGLETRLEGCPRLMAFYDGVLRLTTASASIRTIESTTTLGNVTLRPGGKVLLPFRQLHFNEKVFGSNADEFDPERFLRNKDLSKSSSFRPFGGGSTYCPGRYVARREVLVFIALAVCRFDDISLAGGEQPVFPRLDKKKPRNHDADCRRRCSGHGSKA
jgi:cytochrome P450